MIYESGYTVPSGEHRSRHVGDLDAAIEARRVPPRPPTPRTDRLAKAALARGLKREVWTWEEKQQVKKWWKSKVGRLAEICRAMRASKSTVQWWFREECNLPKGARATIGKLMETTP